MDNKTIYALSTVFGKSGVAVFRISGERALKAIERLTDVKVENVMPRHAYFSALHAADGKPLDHALVLYFKAPSSFTGEDIVEIHSHGSKAVISSLLENLGKIEDFRLAGMTAGLKAGMEVAAFLGCEMNKNENYVKKVKTLGIKHIFFTMKEVEQFLVDFLSV